MPTRRKLLFAALAAVVVLVAAGAAGAWWYLRDDSPDAVSLEAAVAQVDDTVAPESSDGTTDGTFDGDVAGTWSVDTATGAFDYETATGTFVGFRIKEELASIGSTTAVGRTGDVEGSIEIDGTTLTAASFDVDLTTLTTNESRRDSRVQDALETSQFPTATFTLTEPLDLGAGAAGGEQLAVTAVGDLTLHGVTRSVAFSLEAQLTNGTVVVVGSLDIVFSDYDVEVPDSQVVLSVEDHGVLELQFLLAKA